MLTALGFSCLTSIIASSVLQAKENPTTQQKPTAENIKKGTIKMPSGLIIEDITVGQGKTPEKGQTVIVHYTGTLEDGTKFDSSRDRDSPFSFTIGVDQVLKCWE